MVYNFKPKWLFRILHDTETHFHISDCNQNKNICMVLGACQPSRREDETGELRVKGQSRSPRETLSQI